MSAADIGGGRQLEVGILGATGMVGQQFVRLLAGHPWFKTAWLGASERSEGRTYSEAMKWRLSIAPSSRRARHAVDACTPGRAPRILFSALDAGAAKDIEPAFAAAGHIVVSNARSYRMFADVPLVIPEVNADHLSLIARQRRERGWTRRDRHQPELLDHRPVDRARGAAPVRPVAGDGDDAAGGLRRRLPWRRVARHPRQRDPGISGEEEKMESETQKILGTLERDAVSPHPDGRQRDDDARAGDRRAHRIDFDRVRAAAVARRRPRRPRGFPRPAAGAAAAERAAAPIVCISKPPDRPQPRLDVERGNGMTVSVGRIRPARSSAPSSSRLATTPCVAPPGRRS